MSVGRTDGGKKQRGKEESVLAYLHTMCDGPIAKESLCIPLKGVAPASKMILVNLAKMTLRMIFQCVPTMDICLPTSLPPSRGSVNF